MYISCRIHLVYATCAIALIYVLSNLAVQGGYYYYYLHLTEKKVETEDISYLP